MPYELRRKESETAHGLSPQGAEVLERRLKGREQSQREYLDAGLRGSAGSQQPLALQIPAGRSSPIRPIPRLGMRATVDPRATWAPPSTSLGFSVLPSGPGIQVKISGVICVSVCPSISPTPSHQQTLRALLSKSIQNPLTFRLVHVPTGNQPCHLPLGLVQSPVPTLNDLQAVPAAVVQGQP